MTQSKYKSLNDFLDHLVKLEIADAVLAANLIMQLIEQRNFYLENDSTYDSDGRSYALFIDNQQLYDTINIENI